MEEQIKQLDAILAKIDAAEAESGNLSDYLDRGQPGGGQASNATARIDRLNAESKKLKQELTQLVAQLRAGSPEVITQWVNRHIETLNSFIIEPQQTAYESVRNQVAADLIQEWERVRAGELTYAGTNWHYLPHYRNDPSAAGQWTVEHHGSDPGWWTVPRIFWVMFAGLAALLALANVFRSNLGPRTAPFGGWLLVLTVAAMGVLAAVFLLTSSNSVRAKCVIYLAVLFAVPIATLKWERRLRVVRVESQNPQVILPAGPFVPPTLPPTTMPGLERYTRPQQPPATR